MKGKAPDQSELNLFEPSLRQVVSKDNPLRVLAESFPWSEIDAEYSKLYSDRGAPAKPVRLMAGLLVLKHIFNASDEGIVAEWAGDPCFQFFCGGNVFIDRAPCDPSDLPRFRKRIGKERHDGLIGTAEQLKERAGVDRIVIREGTRPGQEDFSYSIRTGFYSNIVTGIRKLARKFSG